MSNTGRRRNAKAIDADLHVDDHHGAEHQAEGAAQPSGNGEAATPPARGSAPTPTPHPPQVAPQMAPQPDNVIKILFLAANPTDTTQLRIGEEFREIEAALRASEFRDRFELKLQLAVRSRDLEGVLLRYQPHIVHFSGHGSDAGEIILENEAGASHPVAATALSQLFALLRDNIRCVVLNACYSAEQAQAIAEQIDCVIGMSRAIEDRAAISFATSFYQALGYGKDIAAAFDLGRTQIKLENIPEEQVPQLLATRTNPAQVSLIAPLAAAGAQGSPTTPDPQRRLKLAGVAALIVALVVVVALSLNRWMGADEPAPTATAVVAGPVLPALSIKTPLTGNKYLIAGAAVAETKIGANLVVYDQFSGAEMAIALLKVIARNPDSLTAQALLTREDRPILAGLRVGDDLNGLSTADLVPAFDFAVGYLLEEGKLHLRPRSGVAVGTRLVALQPVLQEQTIIDMAPFTPSITLRVAGLGQSGVSAAVELVSGAWPVTGTLVALAPAALEPTPLPPQAAMPGDFNIFVARFGAVDAQGHVADSKLGDKVSIWLAKQINGQLSSEHVAGSFESIAVWHDNLASTPPLTAPVGVIENEEDARFWAERLQAQLLIYGKLLGPPDHTTLQLSFYFDSPRVSNLPDLLEQQPFGEPVVIRFADDPTVAEDNLDRNPDLGQRATALVWLVRALTPLSGENPVAALATFKEAEAMLQAWQNPQVNTVLYFYMGQTALLIYDLDEAQRTFQLALDNDPHNAAAQVGLGNYDFTRAQLYFVRRQPLDEQFAQCVGNFSYAGVDINAIAQSSSQVPADFPALIDAFDSAKANYTAAVTTASQAQPPRQQVIDIANIMLAGVYRFTGESTYDHSSEVETSAAAELVAQANTELGSAATQYQELVDRFTQEQQIGLLSYTLYGLSSTQETQGDIAAASGDVEQAKLAYSNAMTNLDSCLGVPPPSASDQPLVERMNCFCEETRRRVEPKLISLGGGSG